MQNLTKFFKSRGFLFLWFIALTLNIIAFLLVFFKSGLHGPNVALKYNVRTGVLWYGQGSNLYSLPFLGLALNLLNFAAFKKISQIQNFLLTTVVYANIFVQLLLLLSLIFLSGIN